MILGEPNGSICRNRKCPPMFRLIVRTLMILATALPGAALLAIAAGLHEVPKEMLEVKRTGVNKFEWAVEFVELHALGEDSALSVGMVMAFCGVCKLAAACSFSFGVAEREASYAIVLYFAAICASHIMMNDLLLPPMVLLVLSLANLAAGGSPQPGREKEE